MSALVPRDRKFEGLSPPELEELEVGFDEWRGQDKAKLRAIREKREKVQGALNHLPRRAESTSKLLQLAAILSGLVGTAVGIRDPILGYIIGCGSAGLAAAGTYYPSDNSKERQSLERELDRLSTAEKDLETELDRVEENLRKIGRRQKQLLLGT